MKKASLVWCVDSPGFGGSEVDLMRVIEMVGSGNSAVVHCSQIDPKLRQFFGDNQMDMVGLAANGNSWRKIISGLAAAFRTIRKFPHALFIVWSHHLDSNRWLQLALALGRARFIIVERLIPADTTAFANSRLTVPIKRFVVRRAKGVFMVGYSQVAHYGDLFQIQSNLISAIPNSRPIEKIAERVRALQLTAKTFRKEVGLPFEAKLIVCTGRLCSQKSQGTLLSSIGQMLENHPNLYVALLGDGPDRDALEKLSENLMPGHVLFPGHSDPIPWLAGADMFVLPSLTEGLPGALIEAMAAGLPCVTTDIPGSRELIIHGQTGLLVPPENPEALAAALRILLENPSTAKSLAEAGYGHVLQNYDESIEVLLWKKLLNENADVTNVKGVDLH